MSIFSSIVIIIPLKFLSPNNIQVSICCLLSEITFFCLVILDGIFDMVNNMLQTVLVLLYFSAEYCFFNLGNLTEFELPKCLFCNRMAAEISVQVLQLSRPVRSSALHMDTEVNQRFGESLNAKFGMVFYSYLSCSGFYSGP